MLCFDSNHSPTMKAQQSRAMLCLAVMVVVVTFANGLSDARIHLRSNAPSGKTAAVKAPTVDFKCCHCSESPGSPDETTYCVTTSKRAKKYKFKNQCEVKCKIIGHSLVTRKADFKSFPTEPENDNLENACKHETSYNLCSVQAEKEKWEKAKSTLKSDPGFTDLVNALGGIVPGGDGTPAAEELVEAYFDDSLPPQLRRASPASVPMLGAAFSLEARKVTEAKNAIDLAASNAESGKLVFVPKESPIEGATGEEKAAAWLCSASNTCTKAGEEAKSARIQEMARKFITLKHEFTVDPAGVEKVFEAVVGTDFTDAFRSIAVQGGDLTSSISGKYLKAYAISKFPQSAEPQQKALYLFGSLVRAHGFPDGNGRTCRALYSLVMLKAGADMEFPSVACEDSVSGLK